MPTRPGKMLFKMYPDLWGNPNCGFKDAVGLLNRWGVTKSKQHVPTIVYHLKRSNPDLSDSILSSRVMEALNASQRTYR